MSAGNLTLWTNNPGNPGTVKSTVARNESSTITDLNQMIQIANNLPEQDRLAYWEFFFRDQKLREEEETKRKRQQTKIREEEETKRLREEEETKRQQTKIREEEETKRQQTKTKIREEEETKRISGMSVADKKDLFKARTETQQLKIREEGETMRSTKKEETRQLELKKKGETFGKLETISVKSVNHPQLLYFINCLNNCQGFIPFFPNFRRTFTWWWTTGLLGQAVVSVILPIFITSPKWEAVANCAILLVYFYLAFRYYSFF